jgi:hypothetical protein
VTEAALTQATEEEQTQVMEVELILETLKTQQGLILQQMGSRIEDDGPLTYHGLETPVQLIFIVMAR